MIFSTEIELFLQKHSTFVLATSDPDQSCYSAPLFYSHNQKSQLIFQSDQKTRHSINCKTRNKVAGSISSQVWAPELIQGLQFTGSVEECPSEYQIEALKSYCSKFAFIHENPILKDKIQNQTFWILTIDWMRMIDNLQGFGFKQEWQSS